jgi:hypothetical protein
MGAAGRDGPCGHQQAHGQPPSGPVVACCSSAGSCAWPWAAPPPFKCVALHSCAAFYTARSPRRVALIPGPLCRFHPRPRPPQTTSTRPSLHLGCDPSRQPESKSSRSTTHRPRCQHVPPTAFPVRPPGFATLHPHKRESRPQRRGTKVDINSPCHHKSISILLHLRHTSPLGYSTSASALQDRPPCRK